MKSISFAKIIPGIILVICIFSLAFWFSSSHHSGIVSERVPEKDPEQSAAAKDQQGVTASPGAGLLPAQQSPAGPVAASAAAEPPSIPGSWTCFRGSSLDNISVDTTPLATQWKSGEPRILWAMDVGEGHAGVAIANSRVYLLDYDRAAQADVLRCLSFADGKELWHYSYPCSLKRNHGMSRTVPAVSGKYVVSLGPKCNVLCADAATGRIYWTMDLVKQYGTVVPPWYAGQCPIIDGDKAIIAPAGKALMIAVDCATGKVLWQAPNPDRWSMTHSSIVPMTLKGKKMYIYCGSAGVAGVSAQDGSILWKTSAWKVKIANVPTPVVIGDGRIFLSGGYNAGSMMLRINEQGGKFSAVPMFSLKSNVFGSDQQTPIYYKGYIYGVIPGGQLVCLDLNGKQVWNSGNARFGLGPYVIAGGMIYVMNDTGALSLVSATHTGYKPFAQARILSGHDSWGPMAIAGGRLIARDLTRMVCIDISKH